MPLRNILCIACLNATMAISCFGQLPAASQLSLPRWQPLDNNGKTVPGGKICTYTTGSFSNPLPTYTSAAANVQNSNPIILDSAGRANVWFSNGQTYRVTFQQPGDQFCPGTGATIWTQDGISNAAALALSNLITTLSSPTGSASIGFIQSQSGAVAETVQAKLRQVVSVMDFGARCDGTTDDTVAVQAAFNSVHTNARLLVPQQCVVSNVYTPSTAGGMFIDGTGLPTLGGSQNPTAGLKAKSGTTGALLTIYSEKTTLQNLVIDCNSQCANPLVLVEAQSSSLTNVLTINGTGSGTVLWNEGSPQTITTSSITGGSTTVFTVANAALTGYPLSGTGNIGGNHCGALTIGYGGANTESQTFTVSGNTITLSGTLTHSYSPGTPIQCHGNDNSISMVTPSSDNNGGAGIDFVAGSDINSVSIVSPNLFGNTGCGILGSGSTNKVTGGSFEGDACAIQLGDSTSRQTVTWDISTQDTESTLPYVVSTCDLWSSYHFTLESQLVFATTPCLAGTQVTMGWGYGLIQFGNTSEFIIKNLNGISFIQPGISGWQNYDSRVATFTNSSAVIGATNSFAANQQVIFYTNGTIPANFAANKVYFVSATGLTGTQFEVATTVGGSPITAGNAGAGTQRVGGIVATATYSTTTSSTGNVTAARCTNVVIADALLSANNALVGTLLDANTGVKVTPAEGTEVCTKLNGFTLQAGANTFTLNGVLYNIGSHYTNASLGTAYTDTGSWAKFIFISGRLVDESQ